MNVEIITPNDGWILHRMAHKLAARIPGVTVVAKPSGAADLVYFMHYHMYRAVSTAQTIISVVDSSIKHHHEPPQPIRSKTAAWFTHREPDGHPLHQRWSQVADAVDLCIASCDLYAEQLPSEKTVVILPGVDDRFQPRKLRVGVACQWAHGNEHRKGLDLIRRLHDECADWIDLRLTNGNIPDDEMVAWYQDLDVYLVTSRYEGGPLPALEAQACGLPIATPRVGVFASGPPYEYGPGGYGVYQYEAGNFDMMRLMLKKVDLKRQFTGELPNRDFWTWDRFAAEHQAQFEKLLKAEAV